jgi:hypothetical protein
MNRAAYPQVTIVLAGCAVAILGFLTTNMITSAIAAASVPDVAAAAPESVVPIREVVIVGLVSWVSVSAIHIVDSLGIEHVVGIDGSTLIVDGRTRTAETADILRMHRRVHIQALQHGEVSRATQILVQ